VNTPSHWPTRWLLPFCAVIAFVVRAVTVSAVDVYWTGAAGDGLWSNPTNWSPTQVPADPDNVHIVAPGNGTIDVDGAHSIHDLAVGSGSNAPTLHLPSGSELLVWGGAVIRSNAQLHLDSGTLRLDFRGEPRPAVTNLGTLRWSGGFLEGQGSVVVETDGQMLAEGAAPKAMECDLLNLGTFVWNTSQLGFYNTVTNAGRFVLQTNCDLEGFFVNMAAITVPENAGLISLKPIGIFISEGGFQAETNSTLELVVEGALEFRLLHGTWFAGPGLIRIRSDSDSLIQWGGITYFNHTVEMDGGQVVGHPILWGPDHFRLLRGSFDGLTVQTGVQFDAIGGLLENTIVNTGATINVLEGGPLGLGNLTNNGTIRMHRGTLGSTEFHRLINNGVVLVETNCDLTTPGNSEFHNTGMLEAPADAGIVALTLGGAKLFQSGTIRAGSNTTLELMFGSGSSFTVGDGAQFEGSGLIHMFGITDATWEGTNVVTGLLRVHLYDQWFSPKVNSNMFTGPGVLQWSQGVLGSVTFDSGFNVQLAGDLYLERASTNNGTIRFVPPFGYHDLDPPLGMGVGFVASELFVNSGTLSVETDGQLYEVSRFDGAFINAGPVVVPADLGQVQVMMAGQITNTGPITVGSNSILHLFGDSDMLQLVFDTTVFQGEGAIEFEAFANATWIGTNFIGCPVTYAPQYVGLPQSLTHATLTGPGPIEVRSGALWDLTLDTNLTVNVTVGVVLGGGVTNLGTLNWLAMNGDIVGDDADAGFYNAGRFVVDTNAILTCRVPFQNAPSGVMEMKTMGETSNFSSLTNAGQMEIQFGAVGVTDGFAQTASGVARFALSGYGVGWEHGRLDTFTNAPLAGAFEVVLANGFVPTNGSVFQLVTFPFDPPTGQFAPEVFPALPASLGWQTEYRPNDLLLRVVSPLTLTAPTMLGDGSFRMTLSGTPGQTNVLMASTNLLDWTPLVTNALVGGSWTVTDSNAPSFPRRFYRAE